jgi:hypothetical protein
VALAVLLAPVGPTTAFVATADAVSTDLASPPTTSCPIGAEQELATMVNSFRVRNGRLPLLLSSELTAKAQAWIEYLAARHDGLTHSDLSDGVSDGWTVLLENLAYSSVSLASAEAGLESSVRHRANLLDSRTTEMGLGVTRSADGLWWVAQVFAGRASPTPEHRGIEGLSAFRPVTPFRLHETSARLPAGRVTALTVAGYGPVPSSATSATVVIEGFDAEATGALAVIPSSGAPVAAWNLRVGRGAGAATTVVAPLDGRGRLLLRQSVAAQWRITVVGFGVPRTGPTRAGRFVPVTAARLLDTRTATSLGWSGGRPGAGSVTTLMVTGRGGLPPEGTSAVVLNVTAADPAARGWLQAGRPSMVRDGWHDLVVPAAGVSRSTLVVVPVDSSGTVALHVSMATDLVVDAVGWYTDSSASPSLSGLFVPVRPTVVLDERRSGSRTGLRTPTVGWRGSLPRCVGAVVGTATVIPDVRSFLQAGPVVTGSPGAWANVNGPVSGRAVANSVWLAAAGQPLGASTVGVLTPGAARAVLSVSGWFV